MGEAEASFPQAFPSVIGPILFRTGTFRDVGMLDQLDSAPFFGWPRFCKKVDAHPPAFFASNMISFGIEQANHTESDEVKKTNYAFNL